MKKGLLSALLFSIILVLAACGGEESDSKEADTSSDTSESEQAPAPDPNNEVNLVATNFDLGQDVFTVKAGEEVKVTLTNEEGHHGISIDEFDIEIQGDGEATFTPTKPGEYKIYCNIMCGTGHAEMAATLVVQ
ncbi:cytochrome C oxidase subunit II [Ornithinibacillus sp. 179-J 7C1 HS]|uniref:cytochrome C oxidase subunit II n=1 Tax=Ornithinibacillus sp. 179-J 7C1 HS TaxID=3142384 RepID=UPI00399F3E0D